MESISLEKDVKLILFSHNISPTVLKNLYTAGFLMKTRYFIKTSYKQKVKTFFLSTPVSLNVKWVPRLRNPHNPANIYLLKWKYQNNVWNLLKVNNKNIKTNSLMSFWCLYCYLSTYFISFSSFSVVQLEQLNIRWKITMKS